jgi:hypothetical protein
MRKPERPLLLAFALLFAVMAPSYGLDYLAGVPLGSCLLSASLMTVSSLLAFSLRSELLLRDAAAAREGRRRAGRR